MTTEESNFANLLENIAKSIFASEDAIRVELISNPDDSFCTFLLTYNSKDTNEATPEYIERLHKTIRTIGAMSFNKFKNKENRYTIDFQSSIS